MTTLQSWLLAVALGLTIAASCNLDGPSDIEVMRLVAEQVQQVEVQP